MSAASDFTLSQDARVLLGPWPGSFGGLPPYDHATPIAFSQALPWAVDAKRRAVKAITGNSEPPSFENTVEALEGSGRQLRDLQGLFKAMLSTAHVGDMPEIGQALSHLVPELETEIALDRRLYERIDAVWRSRHEAGLDAEEIRLVEVLKDRMHRAGAGLDPAAQARLKDIAARLARLSAQFQQNLMADEASGVVWLESEEDLAGLPDRQRQGARQTAKALGREDSWAIPNRRPAVWSFLTCSTRRDLREQVWRMWNERCRRDGPHDNRPVIREMLQLRGERAALLGDSTHAHSVLATRMAGSPEVALDILMTAWRITLAATALQVADYQTLAEAEGADFELAPWDRLHYAEKLRQKRFSIDSDEIKQYFPLDRVLEALFWSAGHLHGLSLIEHPDVPRIHESIRVYEVQLNEEPLGILSMDLFQRDGKAHGSHVHQVRCAESFRGRVLPVLNLVSGLPPAVQGETVLLPWEFVNVLFHEFGHALHMLFNRARYPSLGSLQVAWDFVELPALLNEYWLRDRELLKRFARHHKTGESIPEALLDRLESSLHYDRIFSVNLDYLGPAIVDLKLHLMADGSGAPIDAVAVERQTLCELGMPTAWDLILPVTTSAHSFAGAYDAGLYSYLWADMMAAMVAEKFKEAPGGFYDFHLAQAWRDHILTIGHTVEASDAFRRLCGRDPEPGALMRRFGLMS